MGKRAEKKQVRQKIRKRLGQLTAQQVLGDYDKLHKIKPRVIVENLKAVLSEEEFKLVKRFPDAVEEIIDILGESEIIDGILRKLGKGSSFGVMAKIKSAVGNEIRNIS